MANTHEATERPIPGADSGQQAAAGRSRQPAVRLLAAAGLAGVLLTGCTVSSPTTPPESPLPSGSPSAASTSPGAPSPTIAAEPGDLGDPCTLLPADDINAALGTEFGDGQLTDDAARQISTCRYTSEDMTQIVGVSVSRIDGKKSFGINQDLAETYFGGNPEPVQIPGADQAYLVIAETFSAPVVGMLVRGNFALVQVGVEGATPEQGKALAAQAAARMP